MTINNEDLIGSIFPNVHISRIMLQSKEDKLMGNVQFVLQDVINHENDVVSWIEDSGDIFQYFTVIALQSTDQTLTDLIVNASKEFGTTGIAGFIRNLTEFATQFDLTKLQFIPIKPYPAGKTLQNLVDEGKAEKVVDHNGSEIYNIYFDINFLPIANENPDHLSYLFLTYYNLSKLLQEQFSDLASQQDIFSLGVSELTVENVILNGELEQKTFIFEDSDNNVWPGPIHTIQRNGIEVYRSGQTEDENSIDLTKIEIENNKIQDFRQLRRITDLQNLQLDLDNGIFSAFQQRDLEREISNRFDSSISDLYPSFDSSGNVALSFAIDFKKMFIKNSIYGQVLNRLNTKKAKKFINNQFKMASIESIVAYCKRIDLDDSLSQQKQAEEVVAQYYGENKIESAERPLFFSIGNKQALEQLRFFSLKDEKKKKAGVYQYSIEIEYKDNVVETINSIIKNLKKEKTIFEEYYSEAIATGAYNQTTNRFNARAFSSLPYLERIRNFQISGRFFLSVLDTFFDVRISEVKHVVSNWLNPTTGTPQSIFYTIKLYNNLISTLESSIAVAQTVNNSLNEKNEGFAEQQKTQSISKIVKIKKVFSNTIDLENFYTFEYLNQHKMDNTGFRSNSLFAYETLKTDLIVKKINPNSELTLLDSEKELVESVHKKLSDTFSSMLNLNIYPNAFLQISNSSVLENLERAIPIYQGSFFNKPELPVTKGVNINPFLLTLLNPSVSDNKTDDFSLIVSAISKPNIFWNIQPNSASIFQKSVKNLFKNTTLSKEQVKQLPNQIKSLIKMRLNAPELVMGDGQVRFKYELIKRVNVLAGFQYNTISETFDLRTPLWLKLTDPSKLDKNMLMFCRLVDYKDPKKHIHFNNALKEQITNEYFFLNSNSIDDHCSIIDGTTNMSVQMYAERCKQETKDYFSGDENPDLQITIESEIINPGDNIKLNEFGYLSPLGVYFDKFYKLINYNFVPIMIVTTPRMPIIKKFNKFKLNQLAFESVQNREKKYDPNLISIYSRNHRGNK